MKLKAITYPKVSELPPNPAEYDPKVEEMVYSPPRRPADRTQTTKLPTIRGVCPMAPLSGICKRQRGKYV